MEGTQVYTKDITFLLRLLQTSKQSGLLLVECPGQNESTWQGQFQLDKGVVLSCLVCNKSDGRVLLSNDEAVHWLISQGRLSWTLAEAEQFPGSLPPALPPHEEAKKGYQQQEDTWPPSGWLKQAGDIPQRTPKGRDAPVNAFPSREHRQVFALIDGRRTVEEIVHLLHKPPDSVIRVLKELRAAGFIA